MLGDRGFVVSRRHVQPPVREPRIPSLGDIDKAVHVRPVLVLGAQVLAVGALVVPTVHAVEEVADIADERVAPLGLKQVAHLEVLIARGRVVVRIGAQQEPLVCVGLVEREMADGHLWRVLAGAYIHAVRIGKVRGTDRSLAKSEPPQLLWGGAARRRGNRSEQSRHGQERAQDAEADSEEESDRRDGLVVLDDSDDEHEDSDERDDERGLLEHG